MELTITRALYCEACESFFEEEDAESPLYECQDCGTLYNRDGSADGGSHRCPDCNKFGAKIAEHACPDCGDCELEEVDAIECDGCGDKALLSGVVKVLSEREGVS